jgi:alpha-tubulin suppressor-like RCC1 family protein
MLGTLGVEADGNVEAPDSALFGLENVRSFGIGALHGVSLRQDNQLFAWGWSFEGSLGGGESTIDRWGYRIPVLVTLPTEE